MIKRTELNTLVQDKNFYFIPIQGSVEKKKLTMHEEYLASIFLKIVFYRKYIGFSTLERSHPNKYL